MEEKPTFSFLQTVPISNTLKSSIFQILDLQIQMPSFASCKIDNDCSQNQYSFAISIHVTFNSNFESVFS